MNRFSFTLALCSFIALVACSGPGPTPTASHFRFHAGQNFTGAFHQITTGQSDIQSLGSEFTAQENFHVVSVDAQGNTTISVVIDSTKFTASTQSSEPISTPAPFQFAIDSRGQVLSGNVWPVLGALQSLPALDQFCVPLPSSPLSGGLSWKASAGHAGSTIFSATVDSFHQGYAVPMGATVHTNFSTSSNSDGITITSVGSADQRLACRFDPLNSRPLDLQSNIDFRFTLTAALGSASQSMTSTGSINTTLTYSF